MDFTLGLITGVYAVIAVIVFYVVYIIEVRLDLPAIVNGNTTVAQSAAINTPNNNNNNNNNNDNNRNEFSNVSETRLRQLIEAIIAETIRLPALSSAAVSEVTLDTRHNETPLSNGLRHRTEHYFKPKIYQDLLATAVLNKIVDKQSNARRMSDSTPNLNIRDLDTSSGSSMEPHSDCSDTENMLNQMVKTENASAGGSSRNLHSRDRSTKLTAGRESVLSDYIASHMVPLPDLSAPATESEEEYASVASSTVGDGNWEDNWLFKKKRSTLSAPVASGTGMLVPAPKEDVRAQIGDKTADEVSDLSEMGSDTDDSSLNLLRNKQDPLNDRLLNKHLIGGQNTKLVLDELIDRASMISSTSPYENEPAYTETKNEHVVDMAPKTEAFNASVTKSHAEEADGADSLSLSTNFEDTTESTELSTSNPLTENITLTHVEINTAHSLQNNRFVNDLLKRPTTIALSNATINTTNSTTNTTLTNGGFTNGSATNGDDDAQSIADNSDVEDGDIALLRRFLPGSIAEREYKKWNNAVEMPNNPYAPDALKRRISGSRERFIDLPNISPSTEQNPIILRSNGDEQNADESSRESVNRRYSRDYYINDAKQSAASPKRQLALETLANSNSDEPTTENITINEAENADRTASGQRKATEYLHDPAPDTEVFQALPALVVEEPVSLETVSNESFQSVNTNTSDDSDTVRIYDFTKQETTTIVRESSKPPQPDMVEESPKRKSVTKAESELQPNGVGPTSPTRGATPPALKFLQPKRKLIEPCQVLSFDEEVTQDSASVASERVVIEQEVAQALPSVKALAKAFLVTSDQYSEKPQTAKRSAELETSFLPSKKSEISTSVAEIVEKYTIASDFSTFEADDTLNYQAMLDAASASNHTPSITSGKASPPPVRTGFLQSNIAFFENLKFK